MKLKRLIVQGFKSFKDRQIISFDDGITGIVGPNGCGKSNIVDALFWVMGEQSAKHLRGNSMKDLIFAGSSKYSPGSFAEVTLVLENDEGKLIHIGRRVAGPTEIQLTRKLYRNGETEYRINGEPCRLRDIQEVFMDTGAGAKSYSIIAQGEINRLVQAKPIERRVIIEEVAGITKFKMRKRESMRKIEVTRQNLSRLQDLQTEIEKNLQFLGKQAERAERARSLKEKIRRSELSTNAHKVFDQLRAIRDGRKAILEKTVDVETWRTRREVLEISLEDERYQRDQQAAKIEELQREYNEISRDLAAREEKLRHLCTNCTDKEKGLELREKEIQEIGEELNNRQSRRQALVSDLESLKNQKDQGFNFSALEESVSSLKSELELERAGLAQFSEELSRTREELNEVDQIIFRNSSRMQELSSALQDITQEIEVVESQYSGLSKSIADEREAVNAVAKKVEELEKREMNIRSQVENASQEYKESEKCLQAKTREFIQVESKLLSLKEISTSLTGVKEGAADFLRNVGDDSFALIGQLIQSEDQYARGVQLLIQEFANVLVSSEENYQELFAWLESDRELGLDLWVSGESSYSAETIERLELKGLKGVVSLGDVVQVPEAYASHLKLFFEGFYLIPELSQDNFEVISSDIRFKAIASFDGKFAIRNLGGGKLFESVGQSDPSQGVVERNNKIKDLEGRFESLSEEVKALDERVCFQGKSWEELQSEHDGLRNELTEVKSHYAAKSSALNSKLSNKELGNARLDILKNRKVEISKSRLDIMESEEKYQDRQKDLQEKVEALSHKYGELNKNVKHHQTVYSMKQEELLEKKVLAKSFEERFQSFSSQIEDIEEQISRQQLRLDSNRELVKKFQKEILETERELEALEASNSETASLLVEKEEVLNLSKNHFNQLLHQMQKREDEAKKLNQDINKAEKTCVELETKLEQYIGEEEKLTRDVFEKYRVDLRDAIGKFLEYMTEDYEVLCDISNMYQMETEEGVKELEREPYDFSRRYGNDLKEIEQKLKQYRSEFSGLGEINWQAIEDFERQKRRYDFLGLQEHELKQSLEDLDKAIAHIDVKSKERFKAAFVEVDDRFKKVFPIIFGGGRAELKIIGDVNDVDCGVEIIAQPPGKKMQNINLMSGGEKALTAMSLIFSIFLVKPSPFCFLDEVDAPLDDVNVGRFNELLREMSGESQFILITHNKKTMELNDTLYGVTMQEPGVSKAVSVQLH